MNPSLVIVGNVVLDVQVDGVVSIKYGIRVGDWILVDTELVPGVDISVVGVNPSVGDCVAVPSVLVVDTELLASIKCGVEVDSSVVDIEVLIPVVDASVGDTELLASIKCGVEVDASVVDTEVLIPVVDISGVVVI